MINVSVFIVVKEAEIFSDIQKKKKTTQVVCPLGSDINNNPFNQNLLKCVDDSISKAYIYDLINVSNQVKICHSKIKKKQYNHIQIMLWMELC